MIHADRAIPGWFPETNRNHLIWLIRSLEISDVIEVGAFLGKTTLFFAQRVSVVHSIDYWSLDHLTSQGEIDLAKELGLPLNFKSIWEDNIIVCQRYGHHFARVVDHDPEEELLPGPRRSLMFSGMYYYPRPADLVYIDGDHSYDAVLRDIRKYEATKIVCGDDYGVSEGVTRAVDDTFTDKDRLKIRAPFWWWEVPQRRHPGEI
jgi:hypothetical protein